MDRREFFKVSAATPVVAQLWPDVVFSQPNAKEYEKRALEFCEKMRPVGQGTCCYWSVTGEPYVVIQVGWKREIARDQWIKKEGECFNECYGGPTPEEGLESFKEAFLGYVADKPAETHTLYWRRKPEMSCRIDIKNGHKQEWYRFYARLLVTKTMPVELYKRAREGTLVNG